MKSNPQNFAPEPVYRTEQEAAAGLNTCGYAGKWKKAQEACAKIRPIGEEIYWTSVRQYFLELGGDYVQPVCTPAEPVATLHSGKPVGMSYTEWMLGGMPRLHAAEPMKVREG